MRDVLLLRTLARDPHDPRLAALLLEAAAAHMDLRWPSLGAVAPALGARDPRVRAAALRALAGAGGHRALCAIVAGLDDAAAAVRHAAHDALRDSAGGDPARLAHALFHPREDVRRRALHEWAGPASAPGNVQYAWLPVLLLADEALAPEVRAHLPSLSAPVDALAAVLGLLEAGALDRPAARGLIARGRGAATPLLVPEHARPIEAATRVLERLHADRPLEEEARVPLDGLLDLFADAPSGKEDAAAIDAFVSGVRLALGRSAVRAGAPLAWDAAQVAASAALVCARRGAWSEGLASVAAVADPRLLLAGAVPVAARRAAALSLEHLPSRRRTAAEEWLKLALCSSLVVREDRTLDLAVAAALLRMCEPEPLALLVRVHGAKLLAEAVAREPASLDPLLALDTANLSSRMQLYRIVEASRRVPLADLYASLLAAAPSDAWGPFGGADRLDATLTAARLLAREAAHPALFSPQRAKLVAEAVFERARQGGEEAGAARLLGAVLARPSPWEGKLGPALVDAVARASSEDAFAGAVLSFQPADVRRIVEYMAASATFPHWKATALAYVLRDSSEPEVSRWARERCASAEEIRRLAALRAAAAGAKAAPPPGDEAPVPLVRVLSAAEASAISTAPDASALATALEPALKEPRAGVATALLARAPGHPPSVEACAALLAAHDPSPLVAQALARCGSREPSFLEALDALFVRRHCSCERLPAHGDAWLHLFEPRLCTFAARTLATSRAVALTLELARALAGAFEPLGAAFASAVGRHLEITAARERPRFEALADEPLAAALVDALLDERTSSGAATGIAALQRSAARRALLEPHRDRVLERLVEIDDEARFRIRDWIDATGLRAERPSERPALRRERAAEALRLFPGAGIGEGLLLALAGEARERAEAAALRLAHSGEAGAAKLLEALSAATPGPVPPSWALLAAQTLALWPEGASLEAAAALVADEGRLEPEARFLAACGLVERGREAHRAHLLAAVAAPSERRWYRASDPPALERLCPDAREVAIALARSPHFHAYAKAVERLLALESEHPREAPDTAVLAALAGFLDQGCQRPLDLRLRAARRLRDRGDLSGLPVLLRDAARRPAREAAEALGGLPLDARSAWVALDSVLAAGPSHAEERLLRAIVDLAPVEERAALLARVAEEARGQGTRTDATGRLISGERRDALVTAIATRFAWGVRTGRELMRRLFRFRPLSGDELGYTRLETSDIHVNILPLLRADPLGPDVVDGLIVHELGHHLYHARPAGIEAWKLSEKEGIQRLFNVVLDEHLERNLRALSDEHGDKLKRLGAYAFQRRSGERPLLSVIAALQHRAAPALAAAPPGVAKKQGHILVLDGKLLLALERAGSSFSRFFRALRQNLGNRWGDARVAEGLALFGRGFRASSIDRLLEIARELRRIFGAETFCLERGLDGTAGGDGDAEERAQRRAGITDEEIDAEVKRILEPPRKTGSTEPPASQAINVGPDERVNVLSEVVPLEHDRDQAAALAKEVAGPAALLRRYLASLGLATVKRPMRVRGRRVDQARLRPLVVRGDPRALTAREVEARNDLFIGIVVDCSGSMGTADRIARARRMAALIAEAVRGLDGVDAHFWGFTDRVIYDAGDARRPAVHALKAGGGNDDAAALAYAAGVAKRSKRGARLLVMISDGLPTECSVAALRGLVRRLGRQGYSCAQVALRKLEEVLFPHYVVVESGDVRAQVRRFGMIVARLVRGTVRR